MEKKTKKVVEQALHQAPSTNLPRSTTAPFPPLRPPHPLHPISTTRLMSTERMKKRSNHSFGFGKKSGTVIENDRVGNFGLPKLEEEIGADSY